ncbi:Oxidoreductase BOA17 [Staphylotrichum tortipilum]|uniref:Oxidoreductase BOA17 n=1 Tax=Staphylotrichum tortipilum TaxID=2831512 RepID=A0AAN6MAH3_9PEZI|nr:Oxidoreductase BOA17 [Staphylotrichum longicolle]
MGPTGRVSESGSSPTPPAASAALSSRQCVITTARSTSSPRRPDFPIRPRPLPSPPPRRSDASAVAAAIQTGHSHFGRLDVVVNNADYANTASLEDMDLADFEAQVAADFFGVVYVTKAALPILREQRGGHIFQVSSLGARVGTPGLSAYQASKWAVGRFSTVVGKEVAPLGIKMTVLEPGGIRTDWAGVSMKIPEISEPYKGTVGADAPLRLVLGPQAVELALQAAEELAALDRKWVDMSRSSAWGAGG